MIFQTLVTMMLAIAGVLYGFVLLRRFVRYVGHRLGWVR